MTLWMVFAGLTAVVLALLLAPLLRRGGAAAGRVEYDLAVYRDQLKEVDLDVERGLLTPQQAEAARTDVKRRMLAAADQGEAPARTPRRATWAAVIAVLVVVPGGTLALYERLGAPGLPDQPYLERQARRLDIPEADARKMIEMVENLAARLENAPDDGQGWLMLARSYKALARYDQAAAAYRHVIALGARDGDTLSSMGEVLVLAGQGEVTAEAAERFAEALRSQPGEPRARFYLGEARLQQGDARGAIAIWRDLETDAPADAPWLASVRGRIAATAEENAIDPASVTPAAPDIGAAGATVQPSDADQRAVIRGMVEGLAAKLKENPDDEQGWSRLGRSYLVLGDTAKAKDAYGKAAELNPFDVDIKLGLAEALLAETPQDAPDLPPEFVAVMRQVRALAPDNPEALYFLGLAEAQAGERAKARELWSKLLDQMPKDAPGRADLQKRFDALGG